MADNQKSKLLPLKTTTTNIISKPKSGAVPYYSDHVTLQIAIDDYFATCEAGELYDHITKQGEIIQLTRKIPMTVPGLAYHLGFVSRQTVSDYCNNSNKMIADTMTRARLRIETERNFSALSGTQNPKFSEFDLKNNFGWIDQQHVDHTIKPHEDVLGAMQRRLEQGEEES